MSTNDLAAAAPTLPESGAESAPSRWSRWSDRLNPILVREVQQAVKGRVFSLTVWAALIIGVIIAITVAGDYQSNATGGRNAFDAGLATLVPLLIFVVPMQAYQSMRLELRSGIVEQLLLSQLRPRRIVTGKLAAAMVQFVLYVSVMAPLLATSYLLRGVDLPTILITLVFALVFCVTATGFAISAAAQGALPAMQGMANLAVATGLSLASFGLMGYVGSGECVRDLAWLARSAEFGLVTSLVLLGGVASTVLSSLTAQCFLAHAFENRSTAFRVYLFAVAAVVFAWIWAFVPASGRDESVVAATFALVLLGSVFGVFMVTEQRDLSPRVRAHVPRSPLLAVLAAPFLPGRNRGALCVVLYLLLVGAVAMAWWPAFTTRHFLQSAARMSAMTGAYAVIYLALGRWLRGRLPATVMGNHVARFLLPMLLLVCCVAPLLLDVFVQGRVRGWHIGHVMNPFLTIDEFMSSSRRGSIVDGLLIAAGVAVALQLPALLGGVREVLAASRSRRGA